MYFPAFHTLHFAPLCCIHVLLYPLLFAIHVHPLFNVSLVPTYVMTSFPVVHVLRCPTCPYYMYSPHILSLLVLLPSRPYSLQIHVPWISKHRGGSVGTREGPKLGRVTSSNTIKVGNRRKSFLFLLTRLRTHHCKLLSIFVSVLMFS